MIKTAVVILNYNGREWLRKFLPSVIQFSPAADIIVADNQSSDDSIELLTSEFPAVEIIRIDSNRGFCGGYNYALQQVKAEYYVLLNSDVEVTESWLDPIIGLMDQDPTIGAAQPKILSYRDKNQFEYAGAAGGFVDTLAYPFCRGRIFNSIELDHGQFDDTLPVFWATGACLVIRASIYHQLGGLDEDFFAHMEEIDLCWRLHRVGYQVYYVGASRVYHVGGGTLSKSNPRKTYLNFRNGLSLMLKNMPALSLMWKLPVRICLDWLAAGLFFLRGSAADGLAVWKAHFHFVMRIPSDYRKRRMLGGSIRTAKVPLVYPRSIVVDYYLLGKKVFRDLNF